MKLPHMPTDILTGPSIPRMNGTANLINSLKSCRRFGTDIGSPMNQLDGKLTSKTRSLGFVRPFSELAMDFTMRSGITNFGMTLAE